VTARAFTEEERRHYGQGAQAEARVWRYVLPHNQQSDGGTFLLDAAGMFSGQSAYGGYAYRWSGFGPQDFRAFFARCDASYLYGKLHQRPRGMTERLDDDKTRAAIRHTIWRDLGGGDYSRALHDPERFREETELLREMGDFGDHGTWDEWCRRTRLEEPWFCAAAAQEDPECWAFCTLLLPRLQARLRFDVARGKP
jgi:hypothetical protein